MATAFRPDRLELRQAGIGEIIRLRHAELREGLPFETADFEGDREATTLHFGAFGDRGETIGCASFMLSTYEGCEAFQLRGMATRRDMIGRGIGTALLAVAEQTIAAETGVDQLWCNARVPAIGFYLKRGWDAASQEFEIPTAGPHIRMSRRISDTRRAATRRSGRGKIPSGSDR